MCCSDFFSSVLFLPRPAMTTRSSEMRCTVNWSSKPPTIRVLRCTPLSFFGVLSTFLVAVTICFVLSQPDATVDGLCTCTNSPTHFNLLSSTSVLSSHSDSCARGWRLMMICTAYHGCSDLLRPYLFRFLQVTASDTKREFHGEWGDPGLLFSDLKKTALIVEGFSLNSFRVFWLPFLSFFFLMFQMVDDETGSWFFRWTRCTVRSFWCFYLNFVCSNCCDLRVQLEVNSSSRWPKGSSWQAWTQSFGCKFVVGISQSQTHCHFFFAISCVSHSFVIWVLTCSLSMLFLHFTKLLWFTRTLSLFICVYVCVLVQSGRHTKRQMFYLPGDMTKVVKIKTCTVSVFTPRVVSSSVCTHTSCVSVYFLLSFSLHFSWLRSVKIARDVVKELCAMMGLTSELDFDEYGLYADLGKRKSWMLPDRIVDLVAHVCSVLQLGLLTDIAVGWHKITKFCMIGILPLTM